MKVARKLALIIPVLLSSASAFAGGDTLGGAMTANGCFAEGRVAKTFIPCVEKKVSRNSGDFEFQLKATASYRDPVGDGSRFLDQAAVTLQLQLQDPKNILEALAELPVVVETTFCEDQWGCILTSEKQTLILKRPYGYRMVQGRVDYLLPQDFKAGVTQRVVDVRILIPGRSEQAVFKF